MWVPRLELRPLNLAAMPLPILVEFFMFWMPYYVFRMYFFS